ncbi:Bax inhibitor-1/YccA family protein [Steroidobacter sp. S1-65]|uniref:Bax inhibitor-1/YccA family protein n=1 Tax=Steroidobacter gossypii TaxID=2805490 RepID=A0ABS1WZR6_9GAMM|nr:Bax inhibitor-1/YccA family protein [Steroidobacter gossypii]MBM0106422.1 Bax inhibitor-1/YccA family protein [Steroidobacter gossypii]
MASYPSTVATSARGSALTTNRVLRNTYLLLGATLAFSALTAGISMMLNLPHPGLLITLGGYFGLLFAVHKTQNSAWGLLFTFLLTGFMGLTLGPIISAYLNFLPNGSQVVTTALGITAVTFVGLSAYAVKSQKDFSFLGGFLMVGILGAFLLGLVAYFFELSTLSLVVSGVFVIAMAGLILYETSNIIHGGETNYILATVTLYVSIYNLFTSLLHLLGAASGDD